MARGVGGARTPADCSACSTAATLPRNRRSLSRPAAEIGSGPTARCGPISQAEIRYRRSSLVTRTDGGELTSGDVDAAADARHRMTDARAARGGRRRRQGGGGPTVPLKAGLLRFRAERRRRICARPPPTACPGGFRARITGGPAFRCGHRHFVCRSEHHTARGNRGSSGAAAHRHLPLAGAVAGTAAGHRLRPTVSVRRRQDRGVASGLGLSLDGVDVGYRERAGVRRGNQSGALLLISRYREELPGAPSSIEEALVTAVRAAAPAIVASNATVVLALLTLLFASAVGNAASACKPLRVWSSPPSSSSVVTAAAARAVRQRLFWPCIPEVGTTPLTESGAGTDRRIRGAQARPRRGGLVGGPGRAVHRPAGHTDRADPDRAVPHRPNR